MTNQLLDAVVHTSHGPVQAIANNDVAVFRSTPFASAQRFQRPCAPAPWTQIKVCDAFGPIAPQSPSFLETSLGGSPMEQSEDCLTLSVYSPGGTLRPVMVWIHGGAFMTGTGATPWYSGVNLAAEHDVVVVTINYRLGIFGFFAPYGADEIAAGSQRTARSSADVDDVDAAIDWTVTANLGVLDQVAALEWVRDNIAQFGGDPANVTIFGESAGGCSVAALCAMPAADGLFHRAIAQSPSLIQLRSIERAQQHAQRMLASTSLTLSDLATAPTEELLSLQSSYVTGGTTAFAPTYGTAELPDNPADVAPKVPLIVGSTSEEWKLFALMDPAMSRLTHETLPDALTAIGATPELIEVLHARHPAGAAPDLACAASTHIFLSRPIHQWIDVATASTNTFAYLFDWPSPAMGGVLGACHAMEIPFVFSNLHQRGVHLFTGDGEDRASISAHMASRWTSFAHGRHPWTAHDLTQRTTMVFAHDDRGGVCEVSDPFSDLRQVW
jgi:para-nitrobenzyl esterase